MKQKRIAKVDVRRCVACGACANVCPLSAIAVVRGSFAAADPARCVGCGRCAKTCPAGSIAIVEREAAK